MEHNFTEADIMLIEKEISQKSYKDIAFLLDKPVEEVIGFCIKWAFEKGITTYQQLLDEKRKPRAVREKAGKASREKKVKVPAPAKPKRPVGRPVKEPLVISRRIEQEQKQKRDRQGRPIFQTRTVDLSKLHQVRIDHKTCIYIKPGQDPEKVKKAYLKRLRESKSNAFSKDLV